MRKFFSGFLSLTVVCMALNCSLLLPGIPMGRAFALEADKPFKIAIMQAQKGAAQKFRPLEAYLENRGIDIEFIGTSHYSEAARMFAEGKVDGMFSGSGVAGSMMIKGLAYPVLRPVDKNGQSTYWGVIIAPKGFPAFTGDASYFQDKKIICCALASSGEFFLRAIGERERLNASILIAPSHGAAIAGLDKGAADIAIVKNTVWDTLKNTYPGLQQVGKDDGENPNGTLIVSQTTDPQVVERLTRVLLALHEDTSKAAEEVREKMGLQKYIATSTVDFEHTLSLLKRAGVDQQFNFKF